MIEYAVALHVTPVISSEQLGIVSELAAPAGEARVGNSHDTNRDTKRSRRQRSRAS
jgi:hypothetical protein